MMQKPRVMIVAESPFHLALMADLLEANDITTVREHRPDVAARALARDHCTMVVVDLELTGGETPKGIDRLRREASRKDIPLLLVTERGQREAAEQILTGCRTGTVEKPIDTGAFPRKVMEEIRRHTTQMGSAQA